MNMKTSRLYVTLLSALGLAAGAATLSAQTVRTWDGAGNPDAGGLWSHAANWSGDTVPLESELALLPSVSSGSRTVVLDADQELQGIEVVQTETTAINRLELAGDLTLSSTTPFSLMPPAGAPAALQLDFGGHTVTTKNSTSYYVVLDGDVHMGPDSHLVCQLTYATSGMVITNAGTLYQDASRIDWDFDVPFANIEPGVGIGRKYVNTGKWTMTDGASFMKTGTGQILGFRLMVDCENWGALAVLEGSTNMFASLQNRGDLLIGNNARLGSVDLSRGGTLENFSTGTIRAFGKNAVFGQPTMVGGTSSTKFDNGEGLFVLGQTGAPAELYIQAASVAFTNGVGGVAVLNPGSELFLRYTGAANGAVWDNAGVITQDNATVWFDFAPERNNSGALRAFRNQGVWVMTNSAALYPSSPNGMAVSGFGVLNNNVNDGTMDLSEGSAIAFQKLTNSGTLQLGNDVLLGVSRTLAGATKTIENTGAVVVYGTNAVFGVTNEVAAASIVTLENQEAGTLLIGDGTDEATFSIQGVTGAEFIQSGSNSVATVSAGSSLGLLTTTTGIYGTANTHLFNLAGLFRQEGDIVLQPNFNGTCQIRNTGTYVIGGDTAVTNEIRQVLATAGAPLCRFYNGYEGLPGRLTGIGQTTYTNMTGTGTAERQTLALTSSGTISPGAPTGTLELVNTAITSDDGTLEIHVQSPTAFGQLRTSGLGAKFELSGENDTLNIVMDRGANWSGRATLRIYEGGDVTGEFDTLLWNGSPVESQYQVVYGPDFIDVDIIGSNMTLIIIR